MRMVPHASHGDTANSARQLKRGDGQSTLADTDRRSFTGVPLFSEIAELPLFRRHYTNEFVGQVDSGMVAKAGCLGVEGQVIDPGFGGDGIEKDVAGFYDSAVQRNAAVALGIDPTLLELAIERHTASAIHRKLIIDGATFQPGQPGKWLEGGTGSLLRLYGSIEHRMIGVVGDFLPIFGLDADSELIGVEGGAANHGQHVAIARIERHHRAVAAIHGELGDGLKVKVDGKLDVVTFYGRLVAQNLAHLAAIIDDHLPLAIDTHEAVVVFPLDAKLADDIALVVLGELGRIEFLLADFTRVANDMGHHPVLRVQAALRLDEDQLGKEIVVRIDERQVGGSKLLFDNDWHVLGLRFKSPYFAQQIVVIEIEALSDGLKVLFFNRFSRQNQ